jgi:hypothetical protein
VNVLACLPFLLDFAIVCLAFFFAGFGIGIYVEARR